MKNGFSVVFDADSGSQSMDLLSWAENQVKQARNFCTILCYFEYGLCSQWKYVLWCSANSDGRNCSLLKKVNLSVP